MKKIILILILCFILWISGILYPCFASTTEYTTFSEIMMPEGKLMSNFTEEEISEMYRSLEKTKFFGVAVYMENSNVDASYISNTLYSVENKGSTDIVYDVEVDVETTNKVTFSANGSLNGSASGKIKDIKSEIGAKCGVEVSKTTTSSRKEKQKMKLIVEGNSRAIIYLTGNVSVTNGVAAYYISFIRVAYGSFEIVTLKNQYARIEKAKV